MTRIAVAGLLLTVLVAGVCYRMAGPQAAVAAAVFGVVATVIQLGAFRLMKVVRGQPVERFIARWGAGMGLRFLGIVALALAAGLDSRHFPAIPTAAGFLGVLIPLLFLEVRLIR